MRGRLHSLIFRPVLAAGVLAAAFGLPARHALAGADRLWHVSVFTSVWAETNLPEIPYNIVTGKLHFENAWFTSLAASRVLVPDFSIPTPFGGSFEGNRLELEGQIVKHWGKQKHVELTGALVWRTGDWHFTENLGVNFAIGEGISYALHRPRFEKGRSGRRGDHSFRLQNHIMMELEFSYAAMPDWHFVTRIHHRSGMYGLVSPHKTGSNYFGVGIRRDF